MSAGIDLIYGNYASRMYHIIYVAGVECDTGFL